MQPIIIRLANFIQYYKILAVTIFRHSRIIILIIKAIIVANIQMIIIMAYSKARKQF